MRERGRGKGWGKGKKDRGGVELEDGERVLLAAHLVVLRCVLDEMTGPRNTRISEIWGGGLILKNMKWYHTLFFVG